MHKMIWPGAAAAVLVMTAATAAQSMSGSMQKDSMAKDAMAKPESYTGCVAKGDKPNTFVLKDAHADAMAHDSMSHDGMAKDGMMKDGMKSGGMAHDAMSTLTLSSKDVKFDKHVGEQVTVTGTWGKDAMAHDSMSHDGMAKDGMMKDGMAKDSMGKDGMAKDGMMKDGMMKDSMAPFIVSSLKSSGKCS